VGRKAGLDTELEEQFFASAGDRTLVVQSVVRQYTVSNGSESQPSRISLTPNVQSASHDYCSIVAGSRIHTSAQIPSIPICLSWLCSVSPVEFVLSL
jgi:hypothetical protein